MMNATALVVAFVLSASDPAYVRHARESLRSLHRSQPPGVAVAFLTADAASAASSRLLCAATAPRPCEVQELRVAAPTSRCYAGLEQKAALHAAFVERLAAAAWGGAAVLSDVDVLFTRPLEPLPPLPSHGVGLTANEPGVRWRFNTGHVFVDAPTAATAAWFRQVAADAAAALRACCARGDCDAGDDQGAVERLVRRGWPGVEVSWVGRDVHNAEPRGCEPGAMARARSVHFNGGANKLLMGTEGCTRWVLDN